MADNTTDDVYDDPDNILADTDDTVDGATELPDGERADESQSIFTPELGDDDRGRIDELDPDTNEQEDGNGDPIEDEDADKLSDLNPPDEQDGSEG